MSENISEVEAITKDETVLKVDAVEKLPEIEQTPEKNDIEKSLNEPEAVQSEISEKQSEEETLTANTTLKTENNERVECPGVEATETGEESKSDEVIDKTAVDVVDKDADAPPVEDSDQIEPTTNGDLLDDVARSESEHEGEVEDLEEPEECDSNNEMIIGGDDKIADLIDSGSESRHHHKKNRRRILVDDSDESETEMGREEILRSCTPDNSKQGMSTGCNSEEEDVPSEKDEKADDSPVEMDPEASEIIAKEKPGPKSKKSSTYLKLEQEYETRHLFKNAIIIPAVEKKKKPKRVLASEDEESDEKSRDAVVFGIGVEEPIDDEESRLSGANILLSENYSIDPNFIPLEGVQVDAIPEIIPLENPILPQEDETPEPAKDENSEEQTNEGDKTTPPDIKPNVAELQQETFLNPDKSPEYGTLAPTAPSAPANVTEFSMEDTSGAPTILADLSDNKAPQLLVIKKEPDLDQKASEQFLADALRAQFTDQAPTSIKQLEAGTELDMNTTFWGRDTSSSSEEEDNWTSNMFSSSHNSKKSSKSYHYSMYSSSKSNKKRKRDRYESDSESESSSSDDRHRRKKKNSSSKSPHIKKTIYLHKQNQTLRTAIKGYSKKDIKKKVKDRFFDRSLLIPNDIYFGDTKVADHVLHAYNSDALTSSDSDDGWFKQVLPPTKSSSNKYKTYKSVSSSSSK